MVGGFFMSFLRCLSQGFALAFAGTTSLLLVIKAMTKPTEEWQPPADVKPWIVCAACRYGDELFLGPRHWDQTMLAQKKQARNGDNYRSTQHDFTQGFIDQWGRFYTREQAMEAVKESSQPFNAERNSGNGKELYSEGLY